MSAAGSAAGTAEQIGLLHLFHRLREHSDVFRSRGAPALLHLFKVLRKSAAVDLSDLIAEVPVVAVDKALRDDGVSFLQLLDLRERGGARKVEAADPPGRIVQIEDIKGLSLLRELFADADDSAAEGDFALARGVLDIDRRVGGLSASSMGMTSVTRIAPVLHALDVAQAHDAVFGERVVLRALPHRAEARKIVAEIPVEIGVDALERAVRLKIIRRRRGQRQHIPHVFADDVHAHVALLQPGTNGRVILARESDDPALYELFVADDLSDRKAHRAETNRQFCQKIVEHLFLERLIHRLVADEIELEVLRFPVHDDGIDLDFSQALVQFSQFFQKALSRSYLKHDINSSVNLSSSSSGGPFQITSPLRNSTQSSPLPATPRSASFPSPTPLTAQPITAIFRRFLIPFTRASTFSANAAASQRHRPHVGHATTST